jgi:hypothetical protein
MEYFNNNAKINELMVIVNSKSEQIEKSKKDYFTETIKNDFELMTILLNKNKVSNNFWKYG